MDEMDKLFKHPANWFYAFGVAALLGVWWARMTPNQSNFTTVVGVVAIGLATALKVADQPHVVKILWTAFVVSGLGLASYYLLWSVPAPSTTISLKPPTDAPTRSAGPPETASVRLKYSSQQVVEVSNQSRNKDTINLDNAGMLIQRGDANLRTVRLVQTAQAPVNVDGPVAGGPGIEISNASVVVFGDSFLFDRVSAPEHVATVGARKFRIRLLNIRDRSNPKKKLQFIEYTFGISED